MASPRKYEEFGMMLRDCFVEGLEDWCRMPSALYMFVTHKKYGDRRDAAIRALEMDPNDNTPFMD